MNYAYGNELQRIRTWQAADEQGAIASHSFFSVFFTLRTMVYYERSKYIPTLDLRHVFLLFRACKQFHLSLSACKKPTVMMVPPCGIAVRIAQYALLFLAGFRASLATGKIE